MERNTTWTFARGKLQRTRRVRICSQVPALEIHVSQRDPTRRLPEANSDERAAFAVSTIVQEFIGFVGFVEFARVRGP
jgi:hypothetical protein